MDLPEATPPTAALSPFDVLYMQESCAYFAHQMLRGPADPPYNGKFLVSQHHEAWDRLVHGNKRLCVLAPRDHGKTYFFDFAYPIWKAAHNPHGRGYIFSATQDQAVRILSDIKDEIEDNPRLRHLMPQPRETWSKTAIKLANGHRIFARGYGTKIRGAHPNWIVVDDGLNDEDAYSELVRQKHIDYFLTAISNMIVPNGQIVVVGTPFHALDLYGKGDGRLGDNPEYAFRRFPALDSAGNPLWPDRYDATALQRKRREIGSVRFTREFLCEPISDDMSIFPGRLFVGDPVEQFTVRLGEPIARWRELGITSVFIGVDLAISTTTSADYTVVVVLGVDKFGNRWVMDIFRKRGMPYQQQLSVVQAMGKRYDADLIFIESNQMQRVVGDDLIRLTDLPIKKFNTTGRGKGLKHPTTNTVSANKNTLEGGVPVLRVLLENQKFRIPRGDARSVELTDQWISEMKSFTWLEGKLKGVGGHDDTVMALWIADQAVRSGGFSFSTGAEKDDAASLAELMKEQTEEPEEEKDAPTEEAAARAFLEGIVGADEGEIDAALEATHAANLVDEEAVDAVGSVWSRLPGLSGRF
jgi:hypothetical protein